tara:strand:- start:52 stop:219 length:168 start_codon:yes stop_codon:yes gene_type:complete
MIVVQTFVMATGEMESERTINHSKWQERQWLGKHCQWSFQNGRGVQTFNAKDEVK